MKDATPMKDWPTGRYYHPACRKCAHGFMGEKRDIYCHECHHKTEAEVAAREKARALGPQRFTKRPVTIEAMQWDGTPAGAARVGQWSGQKASTRILGVTADGKALNVAVFVETLEGVMRADAGDWIIKGVKGEFYPCKPDIFAASYDYAT